MIVLCIPVHPAEPDIRRRIAIAAESARNTAQRLADIAPGTIPGGVYIAGGQAQVWLQGRDRGLLAAATDAGLAGIAIEPTPSAFIIWDVTSNVLPTRCPAPVPAPTRAA